MRDGTVDPFDLVSREGSSVRRELIEVDEIFEQKTVQFGGDVKTSVSSDPIGSNETKQDETAARGFVPDLNEVPSLRQDAESERAQREMIIGRGPLLPALERAGRGDAAARKVEGPRIRNPKHFHLIDSQGRAQGPLSATDILRLYYKGVLHSSVCVVRAKSNVRVPVAKFVAAISRAENGESGLKNQPGRGHHPTMGASSDGVQRRYPGIGGLSLSSQRFASWLAVSMVGLALLFGSVAGWLVLESKPRSVQKTRVLKPRRANDQQLQAGHPKIETSAPRAVGDSFSRQGPETIQTLSKQPVLKKGASSAPRRKAPSATSPKSRGNQKSRVPKEKTTSRKRQSSVPRFSAKSFRPQSAPSNRGEVRGPLGVSRPSVSAPIRTPGMKPMVRQAPVPSTRPSTPPRLALQPGTNGRSVSSAMMPVTRAVAPAPRPVRVNSPAVSASISAARAAPAPKSGGSSPLIDGQSVTAIGPFSFDRRAVAKCEGACSIPFKGPSGTITASFFKNVWGPILMEKAGTVKLSGLVRKSGSAIKIIISDIQ